MWSLDECSALLSDNVVEAAVAQCTWRGVLNVTRLAEQLARHVLHSEAVRRVWAERSGGQLCLVRRRSDGSLERGVATPSVMHRQTLTSAVHRAVLRWTQRHYADDPQLPVRVEEVRIALLEHDWLTLQLLAPRLDADSHAE